MLLIKLCAYINKALTNLTNDVVVCYFVDVVEPKLIGQMTCEQYETYTSITG